MTSNMYSGRRACRRLSQKRLPMRSEVARYGRGVIVPLVTPLHTDETIDIEGMARLIDHVISGGVNSIFVLGTNGEFQAFNETETGYLVSIVRRLIDERAAQQSLMVGVSAPSLRSALARSKAAVQAGADVLVACAPYYFIYQPQELVAYFSALADAAERPLILYNSPRYTNNPLTPQIVSQLAEHPNIIGIKDSSGNDELLQAFIDIARDKDDFFVSQGAEQRLVSGVLLGADSITPGFANMAPQYCVALWEAAQDPLRIAEAEALQQRLIELSAVHRIRSGISGTKAVLAELGICGATPMAPFMPLDEAERCQVRHILVSSGIINPMVQEASA
jgi:dihydrodipicolinate synthase/N-acetylneuraminate lyase